jgi:hypothetical protein
MKEESFQDIVDEKKISDVVNDKEIDESILILETPHPIKDSDIIEQPRIDYIETWFQSIVGQVMQSDVKRILLSFSSIHIESAPDSLIQAPICSIVMEFIPQIIWMHEWLHFKCIYT